MSSIPITPIRTVPENLSERPQTQISLQPIAAPSILGLYGFAGATFMVAAHMADRRRTRATRAVLMAAIADIRRLRRPTCRHRID